MDKSKKRSSEVALGFGAVGFMVVCCAVMPTLLAAGALGAVGAFLGNPLVVLAGLVLTTALVVQMVRRRSAGAACCPPPAGDSAPGQSTRLSEQAPDGS